MGRKAVRMQLIGGETTRVATFKKRKSSLLKKAEELSIYCGTEVCFAVSKGPHDPAPEAWPSLEVTTQMVSQANKLDKKLARKVAELQFQVQQMEEENQDLQAKIDSSISKLVPLIEPEAGKCVVPVTVQPDLFDIEYDMDMDMDMEEFVNGQPDITEWKGVADCLEPLIGPEAGNCVVPATEQPDLFDIAYDMDMEEFFMVVSLISLNGRASVIAWYLSCGGQDWSMYLNLKIQNKSLKTGLKRDQKRCVAKTSLMLAMLFWFWYQCASTRVFWGGGNMIASMQCSSRLQYHPQRLSFNYSCITT